MLSVVEIQEIVTLLETDGNKRIGYIEDNKYRYAITTKEISDLIKVGSRVEVIKEKELRFYGYDAIAFKVHQI